MSMTVPNTNPDNAQITLFGRLEGGAYVAEIMPETSVPYKYYWNDATDQVVVYIDPDKTQLQSIVAALNDGRLDFSQLQNFGAANGGTSTIPI